MPVIVKPPPAGAPYMCSDLAFFLRGLSPYGLPVWLFQASVYRRTQRVFVEKVSPTPRSPPVLWLFRFVLHSDPRFSPLESLGPCPLLSRRAGWRGPFFLFVFGASSLLVCFSWLVVRHDSIAYRHSDGTSIFRVVSSCFAGTDAVHPYTATSRVRFIRGPVVTRKRRGVGRQRVIARSDYLTQTEYLEETVLRAEARSCAGRRSCSHPWDGTQLCRQAQLLSSMGWPSVFIHVAVLE